jgi:hypothetical protein
MSSSLSPGLCEPRFVLVTTRWSRAGGRKSQAREVCATCDEPGCWHELPPSEQPVGQETRRRVIQEHDRALARGELRCGQDSSTRLLMQRRARPRAVLLRCRPPLPLQGVELGCVQTLSTRALLARVTALRPGAWRVRTTAGVALADTTRRLRDVLPLGDGPVTLLAELDQQPVDADRAESLRKRLRAAEETAARGDTAAERAAGERAAKRTAKLIESCT